jgi:hypothetical protein
MPETSDPNTANESDKPTSMKQPWVEIFNNMFCKYVKRKMAQLTHTAVK